MRSKKNYNDEKTLSCFTVSRTGVRLNGRLAVTNKTEHTNRRFNWTLLGLMLVCMLAFSGSVQAQGFGKIVGNVTDPSGAVIPDAKITATEASKGFSRTATTDKLVLYRNQFQ